MTFGPAGGTALRGTPECPTDPNNTTPCDKFVDTTLARSHDGGQTWRSFAFFEGGFVTPGMMNSTPGRMFVFTCDGGAPVLRWSDDRGGTLAGTFVFPTGGALSCPAKDTPQGCANTGCPPPPGQNAPLTPQCIQAGCPNGSGWGFEGSESIQRVRYSETKSAAVTTTRTDVVRVTYPAISGTKQVAQEYEVTLGLTGA